MTQSDLPYVVRMRDGIDHVMLEDERETEIGTIRHAKVPGYLAVTPEGAQCAGFSYTFQAAMWLARVERTRRCLAVRTTSSIPDFINIWVF